MPTSSEEQCRSLHTHTHILSTVCMYSSWKPFAGEIREKTLVYAQIMYYTLLLHQNLFVDVDVGKTIQNFHPRKFLTINT